LIGINLPRFCYHQELSVAGNCRMCLVEIEKSPKPVTACAMPVGPNMKIFTDTPLVKKARESVLEFLLLNHPLDCPICDQGGECDLQEQVFNFGSDKSRFYEKKRTVENKNCGPLIKTIMTRCIHCTRCVRFTSEIAGINVEYLGTVNRGQQTEITTFVEKAVLSELSGNLIDLCPVGALTSKPYAFVARPWELKSVDSIDIFDSVLSCIRIDYKESKVVRILPRFDQFSTNKEWITDKIRFSYDSFYINRLTQPLEYSKDFRYNKISWPSLIEKVKFLFNKIDSSKICFIIGNKIETESIIATKLLSENLGISKFAHDRSFFMDVTCPTDYSFNLDLINQSDCILLVGTNPRLEASLINLQIQQNVKRKNIFTTAIGAISNSTYNSNKFISLNLQTFLEIIEGTHSYSKILSNAKLPLIIYGSGILNRIDLQQLLKTITIINDKVKVINQNVISIDSNNIGNYNMGISSFLPEMLNDVELLFLIQPNNEFINFLKKFYKSNNNNKLPIIIYQGTHFLIDETKDDNFINYYIPGKTFVEKTGNYFNIENKNKKTSKIFEIGNNLQTRDDSQIIQIFNNSIIKDLSAKMLEFIPFSNYLENKIFSNLGFFNSIKVNKTFLKPIIEDFYLSDSLLQNSIIMGKCSNTYKKNAKNFLFLKTTAK